MRNAKHQKHALGVATSLEGSGGLTWQRKPGPREDAAAAGWPDRGQEGRLEGWF